ncbi:hypothetical protein NE619_13425 [Anaerovorax odorimutans]|uniref:DUF5626 domain-containing protein n=1 Tax=Anaerovorax odorimutans TaxID=109327 RepID=A0ABT1RRA1_9FIRM|nr:hypothetical protein [Anaerovorax odorimutans]MCQ4637729.1 hypothetical protein [Anaerovorax odorimutans]
MKKICLVCVTIMLILSATSVSFADSDNVIAAEQENLIATEATPTSIFDDKIPWGVRGTYKYSSTKYIKLNKSTAYLKNVYVNKVTYTGTLKLKSRSPSITLSYEILTFSTKVNGKKVVLQVDRGHPDTITVGGKTYRRQ